MTTIKSNYIGNLSTENFHVKTGNKIVTDAPVDNNGKGSTFSPTDLLTASLGSCMLTIMGIVAEKNDFTIEGTEINLSKIMGSNPRRIEEIKIDITIPGNNRSDKEKKLIKNAAINCPVAKSLSKELKQSITFQFS